MISEVILCKYGEIVLKGANRQNFESSLIKELRRRASPYGVFKISCRQSTIYVVPQDEFCDMDGMYEAARRVFGIIAVNRAAVCEKTMESIVETVRNYLPEKLKGILSLVRGIKVDVHTPEVTVTVEVRDENAFVRAGQEPGAGGLPLRTAGRGLLLLSGGIDSPVAGCMMAKRGMEIEALHFASFPYTSERAREKVMQLAEEMCQFCSKIHVHVISLTHIQEELRDNCKEEYFTILLRIFILTTYKRTF